MTRSDRQDSRSGPESDHQTRSLRKSDPVSSLELTEFSAFYKTPTRRLILADFYCRIMNKNKNRFKRVLIAAMKKEEK